MNVSDVTNRVKRLFGDEAGIQISDTDIIRWINDGQAQIVLDNEGLLEATGFTSTVADQSQYDLPVDMSTLHSVSYKNRRLSGLSFNEYNESIGDDTRTGPPQYYMVWNNKLKLYPVPDSTEEGSLTIYYQKQPDDVSTLSDSLTVPFTYHNSVVDYVLAQAHELDENYDAADRKKAQFAETTMKLNDSNKWTNQEVYPRITVRPEDDDFLDYGSY